MRKFKVVYVGDDEHGPASPPDDEAEVVEAANEIEAIKAANAVWGCDVGEYEGETYYVTEVVGPTRRFTVSPGEGIHEFPAA